MNQNIDVSIARLSAPVEVLDLNRRDCRCLRRASLYTVAEVVLGGKPKFRSARNIGRITSSRIIRAVASYLGLPEDQLMSLFLQRDLAVCEAPIRGLDLPSSTHVILEAMDIFRIRELIDARANGYNQLAELGAREIGNIDWALCSCLAEAALMVLLPVLGKDAIPDPARSGPEPKTDRGPILPWEELEEPTWSILELRAMQFMPLEAIGHQTGGISKTRVFQLMRQAHRRLWQHLGFLSPTFDQVEKQAKVLRESLGNHPLKLKILASHLASDPERPGRSLNEHEAESLIVLLRTLVIHPSRWFSEEVEPRWPALLFLSSLVEPALTRHPQVRKLVDVRGGRQKKRTSKEDIYRVVARAGEPMHWSVIAKQICQWDGHAVISEAGVHQMLRSHKELFVRTGPGLYGLRGWLSSEDRQSASAPDELIETSASPRRVERA